MERSVHDTISKRKRRAQTLEFKLFEEVFPIKQILDVLKDQKVNETVDNTRFLRPI